MDPVIVMVGRTNEGVVDIEIMPDIPAEELADAIAAAFGWEGTYDIQVNGKLLSRNQSLAEVDAWDGSELLMVASNRPRQSKSPERISSLQKTLQPQSQTQQNYQPIVQKQSIGSNSVTSSTPIRELKKPGESRGITIQEPHSYTLLSSSKTRKSAGSLDSSEESDSQQ